jgi:hypothetical protein
VGVIVRVGEGVGMMQPPPRQESQQLEYAPTHVLPAEPLHSAALRLTEHLVTPLVLVWQQVTYPAG